MKVPPAAAPWPAPLLGRAAAPFLSQAGTRFFFVFSYANNMWRAERKLEATSDIRDKSWPRGALVNEPGDTPVRAGMTSRLEAALTQRAVTGAAEGNQSLVSEVTVH